jgi:hypothetical protein
MFATGRESLRHMLFDAIDHDNSGSVELMLG